MLQSERDNLIKWNGKEHPFYEAYYLKVNDPISRMALWLRYLFLAPVAGSPEASVWAIAFDSNDPHRNFAIKETISMKDVVYKRSSFDLNFGGAVLKNEHASGRLENEHGFIEWDLAWLASQKSFRHYPLPLYFLPWPSTKVVSPNLNPLSFGFVNINGRRFHLEAAPMNQGHIWGKRFSNSWAWANCSLFERDPSASLELLANRSFGLGFLRFGNEDYRFRIRGNYSLANWDFEGRSGLTRIEGSIKTTPHDIIGVTYIDPSGGHRYCYNTKIANAEVSVIRSNKMVHHLVSRKAAAFETVEKTQNKTVPLWL